MCKYAVWSCDTQLPTSPQAETTSHFRRVEKETHQTPVRLIAFQLALSCRVTVFEVQEQL